MGWQGGCWPECKVLRGAEFWQHHAPMENVDFLLGGRTLLTSTCLPWLWLKPGRVVQEPHFQEECTWHPPQRRGSRLWCASWLGSYGWHLGNFAGAPVHVSLPRLLPGWAPAAYTRAISPECRPQEPTSWCHIPSLTQYPLHELPRMECVLLFLIGILLVYHPRLHPPYNIPLYELTGWAQQWLWRHQVLVLGDFSVHADLDRCSSDFMLTMTTLGQPQVILALTQDSRHSLVLMLTGGGEV